MRDRTAGDRLHGGSGPPTGEPARPRPRVRLPGFVNEEDIGLGDVIKRATGAVGIRPCGCCGRRAERLNRWVGFRGRSSR
ncbi:hypothetical protein BX285_6755 [Streptomyces sp. 1114.5]|uniref:hypothetical protein n=1 Tax=unclassified Streptomyces TaxID=2593676 RepID=UPI000BCF4137|nr:MULTISPECIES: hypothetical protein [unclassified Streptomyces]RKT09654.1 hypothetical protein BX285_6755 [Streptomyces sp. 1114.5]SOB89011.1 hypothetical protein SAMN06272789_7340 [Streptomyces sp. 1331.2]